MKIDSQATIYTAALSLALAAPAYALQQCTPSKEDSRVRYCTYNPNQVFEIWTAPGGEMVIQFAEGEQVPEGNVAATDGSRLERKPRGNFLYLKSKAKEGEAPCMVPEPLLVTTKLPNGQLRPYHFQIETRPSYCSETPVAQVSGPQHQTPGLTLTAAGVPETRAPKAEGNLKYVGENGLGAGADVFYAAIFRYPEDEAAKRRAAASARAAEVDRRQAQLLLKQQTSWPYGNQFDGSWNFKYAAHGNLTVPPRQVRDNGYQTVFLFPQMQRVPALFRLQPGATRCNREHDDHNEGTEIPSVHRSGADGDTIIATGTAQGWCLRDGNTVLEILNLAYNPAGATPATGTVSPYVRRVLKDEPTPQDEAPIPLQPEPQPEPAPTPARPQQQSGQAQPQQEPLVVQPRTVQQGD
jgi:type IV secretion system protein VirB9